MVTSRLLFILLPFAVVGRKVIFIAAGSNNIAVYYPSIKLLWT